MILMLTIEQLRRAITKAKEEYRLHAKDPDADPCMLDLMKIRIKDYEQELRDKVQWEEEQEKRNSPKN